MSTLNTMESSSAGVSRSGRVRKKSAKVIEMEEIEKDSESNIINDRVSIKLNKSLIGNYYAENEVDKPLKKKLKIKLSLSGNSVEETGGQYYEEEVTEPVPSLKIKLFPNSSNNCKLILLFSFHLSPLTFFEIL